MIARIYILFVLAILAIVTSITPIYASETLSNTFLTRDIPSDWDQDGDGLFDNISNYQNSGSITARIYLNADDITSAGDALAAFVDGEQRGLAIASEVPPFLGGGYSFLILIYSNVGSGEVINFQFYDDSENTVYSILESYDFISDMIVGSVTSAEVFTLGDPLSGGNDCESGIYDCDGVCDGTSIEDECGVCGGSGIPEGECDCFGSIEDCAGVCGGVSEFDECGICGGSGIAEDECDCSGNVEDCLGVCGGASLEDECGVCNGSGIADGECDCDGNIEDECGVCGGNGITEDSCDCDNNVYDCLGICGGSAVEDCTGVCEGENYFDECGICGGDSSSCDASTQGYINQETGWSFYQSPLQAFYGFEDIQINGLASVGSDENWAPGSDAGNCIENPYSCDVVGAFIDGTCVGWNYVDSSGITQTTIQVQGYYNSPNFQELTQNYCQEGDIPSFYIFDSSSQEIYLLANEQLFNPWSNLEFYYLLGSTNAIYEAGGCIEQFAVNYDDTAEIYDPFDPCYYYQDVELQTGWNIFSLSVLPNENDVTLFNILSPISDELSLVLDETGSGIFKDQSNQWIDNIGQWQSSEGYLIKVNSGQTLELTTDKLISLPLSVNLDAGWNIISYPVQSENGDLIENVLSDIIISGDLYTVFSETGDIYVPSYITGSDPINSIGSMFKDEGYYVKVLDDVSLNIVEPDGNDLFSDEQSNNIYRTGHFNPVWDGNPSNPMTITVDSFLWDGITLDEGDEIGVFDGNLCVGSGVVTSDGHINDSNNQIKVSKDDGSGNGYTEFNSISFRVWKESLQVDIDATIDSWTDISGNTTSQVFEALTTPRLELEVYSPSIISNVSLDPGQTTMNISWNRPQIGDYNIYDLDNNPSNAVVFSVYRDDVNITSNLDSQNFVDSNLDYNTSYSYFIEAISVIGTSTSLNYNSVTIPGIADLTINPFRNQNNLIWENPINTGSDDLISYKIERFWSVDDNQYYDIIADNYSDQNYNDVGLLNSSFFSYRIKSFNSSGSSDWSSYLESQTLSGDSDLNQVDNITAQAEQVLEPPNNIITVEWDLVDGADGYNVYDKNLLIGSTVDALFINSDLLTSEFKQYVITATTLNQESLPSSIIEITTLPELFPSAPDNFDIQDGQNQLSLSWDSVLGYGTPIGGAAVSYNVYKEKLEDFIDTESMSLFDNTDENYYIDFNLNDNIYYCYSIAGINSEGSEGEKSSVACDGTLSQLAASIPSDVIAVGDNQQVLLSWNASEGSPPISYQIYRSGEYVSQTTSTSYSDLGLQKNTTYSYHIVASNEISSSDNSESVEATTTEQSNLLSANIPEGLSVDLPDGLRASEFLDTEANINWASKVFTESEANEEFVLAYQGNPYQPMTIVVNEILYNGSNVPDGSIIAVFDGEKCVGKGQTPLPGGALTVSKNDGSDNGFSEGNYAYIKVWNYDTNTILTTTSSSDLIFEGLGLEFVDLNVTEDTYRLYRNGSLLGDNIFSTSYIDDELESEMAYSYQVSALNILGSWTESNPSEPVIINTFTYMGNAPEFTTNFESQLLSNANIDEDSIFTFDLSGAAIDVDGDIINYFVEPVLSNSQVSCSIIDNQLSVIPDDNYFGVYEISLIAYDDIELYESNTLTDTILFDLQVNSVNDAPILLNEIDDIDFDEDLYFNQDYALVDLNNYIIDVDELIMSEESLVYNSFSSNEDFVVFVTEISGSPILSFYINQSITDYETTQITIQATDQNNLQIEDVFNVIISDIITCVPENDTDGDGVCDNADLCPFDNPNDTDGDGSCDSDDICPDEDDFLDTDNDQIVDCLDVCPNDFDNDLDGDGVCGDLDVCPNDLNDDSDEDGSCDSDDICPGEDDFVDTDSDDIPDCLDICVNDFDNDLDGDGVCGDVDVCPGFDDNQDTDLDGTADGCDVCPNDFDNDLDGDGVCGDLDVCPNDLNDDSDNDGSCDSDDICPGEDDFVDTDNDGAVDCLDICPQDFLDDSDGDGICDSSDVCPGFSDNIDNDLDGTADGCDACPNDFDNDIDGDGVCGDVDACPGFDDNQDTDLDGIADGCDSCPFDYDNDLDNDGVCGNLDQCPGYDDNLDIDLDGIADGCDICPNDFDNDLDGDGICGDVDVCPNDFDNDIDGDGICGDVDVCPNDFDNDIDGDDICGDVDTCPNDFDNDIDADGICGDIDACPNDADNDSDNDGVCGDVDICLGFDDNIDNDTDGIPDGCDVCPNDFDNDNDNDGVCGDVDVCPGFDDNQDTDLDGIVDGCDACPYDFDNDLDGDGICGNLDDCPNDAENDSDNDGVCGDVDTCPGFDDNQDGDSDGIADDCDACPNDFDNDLDGDGVCGDVDACPGFDDNQDTDLDGIADGCDACLNDFDNDLDGDGICGDVDVCPNDADNDLDNDGICDDVDDCIGYFDECGVCNGTGIPYDFCDCFENVLDDCGVCGGDNSTCQYNLDLSENGETLIDEVIVISDNLNLQISEGTSFNLDPLEDGVDLSIYTYFENDLPDAYDVFELSGDTYSFEPYNLELSEPATISILYNENMRSDYSIVKLENEDDETWEKVNNSSCENGECTVDISSFGLYSVARIVDDSYFESCFAHPLEQNYNSFTFVGMEDSDNITSGNDLEVVYNNAVLDAPIHTVRFRINWCSDAWVDLNEDGVWDGDENSGEFSCQSQYVVDDPGITSYTFFDDENWTVYINPGNLDSGNSTLFEASYNGDYNIENSLTPGCGFLANFEYEGYIHSVSDIIWSTFDTVTGLTSDLDFNYVPFDNDYLDAEIPNSMILKQNFPNPFNPVTNIQFELSESGFAELIIYDIHGRLVNKLISQYLQKGIHSVSWDSKNNANEVLPSGLYIYQLNSSGMSISKKMILLR